MILIGGEPVLGGRYRLAALQSPGVPDLCERPPLPRVVLDLWSTWPGEGAMAELLPDEARELARLLLIEADTADRMAREAA